MSKHHKKDCCKKNFCEKAKKAEKHDHHHSHKHHKKQPVKKEDDACSARKCPAFKSHFDGHGG